MTVTRLDIADLVADAFASQGATRDQVLATAAASGAHPRILECLQALPDVRYRTMRDLWVHLPDVDIE